MKKKNKDEKLQISKAEMGLKFENKSDYGLTETNNSNLEDSSSADQQESLNKKEVHTEKSDTQQLSQHNDPKEITRSDSINWGVDEGDVEDEQEDLQDVLSLPHKFESVTDSGSPDKEKLSKTGVSGAIVGLFESKKGLASKKSFKLGIVGGRSVGKSFLFRAIVYRLKNSKQAGALSYFFKDSDIYLYEAANRTDPAHHVNFIEFIEEYMRWDKLAATEINTQKWYRLTLPYRRGFFRRDKFEMDVEFFDGSGEGFFTARDEANKKDWLENYRDTRVMVFCLPLWAAFPAKEYENSDDRKELLKEFEIVVNTYRTLRKEENIKTPVKSILALTMADDDQKTSLERSIIDTWLKPYYPKNTDDKGDRNFFKKLSKGGGINRYLANSRKVSNLLKDEFSNQSVLSANIPNSLNFGAGLPWIIPVSAIHGKYLDMLNNFEKESELPPPNPAHVELPLLVALCEYSNALM